MTRPKLVLYLVILAVEVVLAVLVFRGMEDGPSKWILLGLLGVGIVLMAVVVARGSAAVGRRGR